MPTQITSPTRLTIVVGASRGIGRHLTHRANHRGDAVLACARDAAALDLLRSTGATAGQRFSVEAGDFLAEGAQLGSITHGISAHSGPKTLIVTAATIGPVGPLTEIDIDDWARALMLNVTGPARILAAVLTLLSADDLVVLFAGGGVGGPNPQPNLSGYTTSKAALMHMVEVVAGENPAGPTLVAIAPGSFPSNFVDPVLRADPAIAGERLLADVRRTKQGPFDAADLDRMMDYLETADVAWLSGRCLSARRDTPAALAVLAENPAERRDLFTLRRVDGAGVVVRDW